MDTEREHRLAEKRSARHLRTARNDLRTMRGFYMILAVVSLISVIGAAFEIAEGEGILLPLLSCLPFALLVLAAAGAQRAPLAWSVVIAILVSAEVIAQCVLTGFFVPDPFAVVILLNVLGYVPVARRISRAQRESRSLSVSYAK